MRSDDKKEGQATGQATTLAGSAPEISAKRSINSNGPGTGSEPQEIWGYANHRQQPWKRPLGEYIEHLYVKRFKKEEPNRVTSLEEQAQDMHRKKEEKKAQMSPAKQEPTLKQALCPQCWQSVSVHDNQTYFLYGEASVTEHSVLIDLSQLFAACHRAEARL